MRILPVLLVIATIHSIPNTLTAQFPSAAQMQLEHEAKVRQQEFEFRRAEREMKEKMKNSARTKPTTSTSRTPTNRPIAQPPAQEAATFIKRVRSASSMNHIVAMMSHQRQQQLKEREANYNPKTARETVERMTRLQERPLTEEERLLFGSSPSANELRQLKQIANKAISIKSQSTSDGRATVTVWTHNLAGDPNYRYGAGVFRFVAENGTWKFDSYEDSGQFYSSMD